MDLLGGNVFNLDRGPSQNATVRDFMKQSGAERASQYELEDLNNITVLPGVDEEDDYFNAGKAANEIGLAAAAKGIDVRNPDPDNPQAMAVSRLWLNHINNFKRSGNAIKAKNEMFKQYVTAMQKPYVKLPGDIDPSNLTPQDLARLRNTRPEIDALISVPERVNATAAKSFDTKAEEIKNQKVLDGAKNDVLLSKNHLISIGYTPEQAELLIKTTAAKVGTATSNDFEQQKIDSTNEDKKSKRALAWAKLNKDDKSDERKQKAILRNELIDNVIIGTHARELINGKIGNEFITNAERVNTGSGVVIRLYGKDKALGRQKVLKDIPLDDIKRGARLEINSIINSKFGKDDSITYEDLVSDDSGQSKMGSGDIRNQGTSTAEFDDL